WSNPVSVSSTVTVKKSAFIAYATGLPSNDADAVSNFLAHLTTSPQFNIKRASHLMHAYQMTNPATTGCDDGGESGAGDRIGNLLRLSCPDVAVVVVVLRWYGGVKLGGDRWKCISQVAKEALDHGGFRRSK
ncbi:ribosomal protein S5 domain 2-like protein, partial [Athelia psychrophila]